MAWLSQGRSLWRLVSEIDMNAIQTDAERPFAVGIVGVTSEQAVHVARHLMGEWRGALHPWLAVSAAGEPGALATPLDFGILVCAANSSDAIAEVRRAWSGAKVPFITALEGEASMADLVAREGELERVVLPAALAASGGFEDAIARRAPDRMQIALARRLPTLRPAVFKCLVEETANANARYAFTTALAESVPLLSAPLNLADVLVLTKNQLVMAYKIALGAGKSGRARDVLGEVLGVIGSGFLFRQGARQLIGLLPVVSIVPKVAMAYAGTWAVGQAVALWATKGQAVSTDTVARLAKDARQRGRELAEVLLRNWRGRTPPGGRG